LEKLIELRDANAVELDALVTEMEEMESGEELDAKLERSNVLVSEIKELNEKIKADADMRTTLKEVEESRKSLDIKDEDISETRMEVKEPDMYRKGGDNSFFGDMYQARFNNDYNANKRLAEHQEVSKRDVGSGAFAGLVVPQYLVDDYAPLARAGANFYNAVPKRELPAYGNKVEISRITTGSTAAEQASENAAVDETNMDDTLLTVNVDTIAGQQDVSKQALERGGQPGFNLEDIIFQDLASAYFTKLDNLMINGSGSSGQPKGISQVSGINTVTYTDASPTVGELYPKLADALQKINSERFAPASAIIMHPRRWGFLTAGVDGSNRPLIVPNANAPQNAVGTGDVAKYGAVGQILGVPVITDANIRTDLGAGTEDAIYVVRAEDHILFEQDVFTAKFEETNAGSLTTKLVVYGYVAFASGRYPKGISAISGTGLIAPTF
jgi:HK97 family phage major capsid protein